MNAHPPHQLGCYLCGIHQGFICRDIAMQVPRMDPAEGAHRGPQCWARALTGVTVPFTSAIAIIIPRPFVDAVAHPGRGRVAAVTALPCIGVQDRALQRDILGDQGSPRTPVRMVAAPKTLLPRLAREHTDDGRAIIGRGAVPLPLIGPSAWRIVRVARGCAVFPQRAGRGHRLQRRCRPSPWGGGRVQVGWEALPPRMALLARAPQFPREACRGLALREPTQQQDQSRRALSGFRKDGPGQRRVGALAGSAAISRKMALLAAEAPFGMPTGRASQTTGMEMTFQPDRAHAVIQ